MDYLDKVAYKPGEFEKLQKLFDTSTVGLAKELLSAVETGLRRLSTKIC